MKTRIIVAVVGIPVLVAVIFFAPPVVFGALVGVVAAVAAYEFLRCTEPGLSKLTLLVAMLCAAAVPIGAVYGKSNAVTAAALFLLMLFLFIQLILSFRKEETMALETVVLVLFAAGILPILFASLVRLGAQEHSAVYILFPFVITFSCDSGAYFAGSFFGRHKLAPRVSPNKTLEGSTGGFLCGVLVSLLYGLILKVTGIPVDFLVLACTGFLGSFVCQIGDLAFSAVKRICGIKDYGNLIPGHGGVLDRFDSILFVAPLVEILTLWVPAIG